MSSPTSSERHTATRPISLVVVNYNGGSCLLDCLHAAYIAGGIFAEVILVDNASTDGSAAAAWQAFPPLKLVQLGRNRGPGSARNAGFRAAAQRRVLFADCDVFLDRQCAGLLSSALDAHPRAAIATPAVVYNRDRARVQYCGANSHYMGLLSLLDAGTRADDLLHRPTHKVGSLVSCCFLLDRDRWGEEPPFDEAFFSIFEDHDLGLRSRIHGHEIVAVPAARLNHGEGTEGLSIRRTGRYTARRVYLLMRNRWQVLLKNYQLRTLALLSPMLLLYELFQLLVVLKKGWLTEWLLALGWLVRHRRAILLKRRAVQSARRLPDREVLSGGPLPFTRYIATSPLERRAKLALDLVATRYWTVIRCVL